MEPAVRLELMRRDKKAHAGQIRFAGALDVLGRAAVRPGARRAGLRGAARRATQG
jgi:hypothetical protein